MRFYLVLLLSLFVTPAVAGISIQPIESKATDTEENAYVGLVWSLTGGVSQTPDVSIGFQSVDVNSAGDIDAGYDLNLRFTLNGLGLPETYTTRASHVFGDADAPGTVGIGLTSDGSWVLSAGAQGDNVRLGIDYGAQGVGFTGEVLTLEKIDTPGPLLTCGAFLELVNGNCVPSGPG